MSRLSRRLFLTGGVTLAGLGLLTGCATAQALAAATDPISYVEDVPQDELREQLLLGANAVLEVGP